MQDHYNHNKMVSEDSENSYFSLFKEKLARE